MNQLFMSPLFVMLNHSEGPMGSATILESDPYGLTVAFISISVVLSALLVLAFLVGGFSKIIATISRKTSNVCPETGVECEPVENNGEIIAAIGLALKLHKADLHDRESEVITLNSVARVYSPWSSKIHGLTNLPRR